MDWLTDVAGYTIPFLVILTVLVFVHEMGHYLLARAFGVRIEVFSIGFGRELFGWTSKSGTRWKISLLPLGGYVKMFGDMDAASRPDSEANRALSDAERAVAFPFKPLYARAAIVAGGPLANFAFSIIVFTGLFATLGQGVMAPVVDQVVAGSAAEEAGLQPGDRILAINGESIASFEELQRFVQLNLDGVLDMTVQRATEQLQVLAFPQVIEQETGFCATVRVGRLGISAAGREIVEHGPLGAFAAAVGETWGLVEMSLQSIGQMISGARSTKELSGPLGIAEMSGTVAKAGLESVLWFMAFISVGLGLINLFPIPMLDGGHLLYYAIEAVRRRPLGAKAQEYGFKIGIALVLTLFVVATMNDLGRWFWCES